MPGFLPGWCGLFKNKEMEIFHKEILKAQELREPKGEPGKYFQLLRKRGLEGWAALSPKPTASHPGPS